MILLDTNLLTRITRLLTFNPSDFRGLSVVILDPASV